MITTTIGRITTCRASSSLLFFFLQQQCRCHNNYMLESECSRTTTTTYCYNTEQSSTKHNTVYIKAAQTTEQCRAQSTVCILCSVLYTVYIKQHRSNHISAKYITKHIKAAESVEKIAVYRAQCIGHQCRVDKGRAEQFEVHRADEIRID